jgi:MoaA/NifB/PqqE/SkfB family radical SAM enzyme
MPKELEKRNGKSLNVYLVRGSLSVIDRHFDTLCVELSLSCSQRCVHCSAAAAPGRREVLSTARLQQRLQSYGPFVELYLSGGEPLDHPEIDPIVDIARAHAERVIIYSSGILSEAPAENVPISFTKKILGILSKVSRTDISIYGSSALTHDAITRVPGSFNATIHSLRRLSDEGIPFGVHFVLMRGNEHELSSVLTLSLQTGASRFHILGVIPHGRGRFIDPACLTSELQLLLRRLYDNPFHIEVVMASSVRRLAGIDTETPRDRWKAGFLDVHGNLLFSENHRQRVGSATEPVLYEGSVRNGFA